MNENIINTNLFTYEAELLVEIASSMLKDITYRLEDYLAALHRLVMIRDNSLRKSAQLFEQHKLLTAARFHLTLTSLLHEEAFGLLPEKLMKMITMLGGPFKYAYRSFYRELQPPYYLDLPILIPILKEKLEDNIFKRSIVKQIYVPHFKLNAKLLLTRLMILLK